MNFVVPDGIESIQMYIYNDVAHNGSGNDFALDDIEIHLCAPPVTIEGEAEVCTNSATTLTANFTNDGTFAEPLEYKWWHSTDSVTWTEMSDFNGGILTFSTIQKADSGWYKVAVSGDGNIDNINCRAVSDPFRLRVNECTEDLCIDGILLFREDFGGNDPDDPIVGTQHVPGMDYSRYTQRLNADHVTGQPGLFWLIKSGYYHADTTGGRDPMRNHSNWYLQDDHTYPNDKTRGYLLEIDGMGGTAPFYSTVVHGVCPGTRLTFSAYVANVNKASNYIDGVHARVYPKLKFEIEDAKTHTVLGSHSTGDIPYDPDLTVNTDFWYSSKWYLHGMTFTMPEAVDSIRLTIYNDVMNNGAGNDFALDDIEIRLCMTPDTIRTDTTVCDTINQIAWRGKEYAVADTLRDTVFSSCGFDSIYYELHVTTVHCEEALCMDGILLFREDFGGNDPNDPRIGTAPVNGMSYTQLTSDRFGVMGSGKYLVTKSGYCNGDTSVNNLPQNRRSQWHLQDDHTYPNDRTRGYLLEIDGRADNAAFYKTTIEHLCEGIELTFSAYVANVMTWGQYMGRPGMYAYPRLKFVLTNPTNNSELATYDTGDIPFDSAFINDFNCWQESSKWQLVGMNFTVPVGVDAIQLCIYNYVNDAIGNDFALDDIEIRLCMTPDTIRTDTTVCDTINQIAWRGKEYAIIDTLRDTIFSSCGFDSIYYELHVATKHCESPCPEIHYATRDTTVCDTLMPFTWHGLLFNKPGSQTILLKDEQGCDSIEIDYTLSTFHCEDFCLEGKLLFREDFGGNAPNDPDVSCINNPSILYRNGCNTTGRLPEGYYRLTKKDQGYYNHQWVDREDHSYPNDASRGYFLMIEGANNHLFYSTFLSGGAEGDVLSFSAYVINLHDNIHDGEYQLPKILIQLINSDTQEVLANCIPSEMPIATHSEMSNWHIVGTNFTLPTDLSAIEVNMYAYMHGHEGNDFGIDDIELRLCQIPQATRVDTIICDTIDAITWRNKIYPLKNELRDTVYDSSGADSIYYILNVIMEHCCPEIKEKTITIGTLCDTLLPYTLYFRDTVLTFKMAGDLLLEFQHPQWDCIDSIYTLHLDTIHCERLYDIIVNKYNWQLLCDNVALRNFFPERTATAFQWYKNEQAIPGATGDDYSEHNELQGVFQLNVHLNDGRSIWSNIIEIEGPGDAPTRVQIYNSQGMPVSEGQMTRGVYLYRYEKGEERWTEKKIVL